MVHSASSRRIVTRVLVIDDDEDLVALLSFSLRRAGIETFSSTDSETALRIVQREMPDLILLDLNIAPSDGITLLSQITSLTSSPVIVISGRTNEDDKVRCFDLGADDYVTKPFGHRELLARITTALKRHTTDRPIIREAVVTRGSLELDPIKRTLRLDGQLVELTATEFRLLHFLMLNAGTIVPASLLLRRVWGHDPSGSEDVVRVTMHRLRRKIEPDPRHPRLVRTVPRLGFVLASEAQPA